MTCLLYRLTGFRGEDFKAFFPIGSYVKTMSAEGGHLGWKSGSSDTIWFRLIWFSGFNGEDLNVIFYQNMPNLHNRYKSADRKISQKKTEHMLNDSLPCSCS
jgi:hypothetical protein